MAPRPSQTFSFQVHEGGDRTLDGIFRLIGLGELEEPRHGETSRYRLGDRVDNETRKRLEKLRRGQGSG